MDSRSQEEDLVVGFHRIIKDILGMCANSVHRTTTTTDAVLLSSLATPPFRYVSDLESRSERNMPVRRLYALAQCIGEA